MVSGQIDTGIRILGSRVSHKITKTQNFTKRRSSRDLTGYVVYMVHLVHVVAEGASDYMIRIEVATD
jgi:hypothetical protein